MLKVFANLFWINTSRMFQLEYSRIYAKFFKTKISRLILLPYCLFYGLSGEYLEQFEPESQEQTYSSFSDFFQRKYKILPHIQGKTVWPCEGYICDWGGFSSKNNSVVKGQTLDLNTIFMSRSEVTEKYFFVNIFLHNQNYHRVHSMINGTITRITRIPGDLIFLRPWFYKREEVSYPAFRNERVVFEIIDENQQPWYLAMVGGFGVGSIEIEPQLVLGAKVQAGQEIAKFNLGSTVCIACPEKFVIHKFLQNVTMGQKVEIV